MDIPNDLLLEEIWKFLPTEEILRYCQVNHTLNSICNDNETWVYLIQRDFKIKYSGKAAKREYMGWRNHQKLTKIAKFDLLALNHMPLHKLKELTVNLSMTERYTLYSRRDIERALQKEWIGRMLDKETYFDYSFYSSKVSK